MLDERRKHDAPEDDFVEFLRAGSAATGEFRCSSCGYGVTVHVALPQCPMCTGTSWESAAWSPAPLRRPLQ